MLVLDGRGRATRRDFRYMGVVRALELPLRPILAVAVMIGLCGCGSSAQSVLLGRVCTTYAEAAVGMLPQPPGPTPLGPDLPGKLRASADNECFLLAVNLRYASSVATASGVTVTRAQAQNLMAILTKNTIGHVSPRPTQAPAVAAQPRVQFAGRVRYRAVRPGTLPSRGAASLAGIRLPAGHRVIDVEGDPVRLWESNGPVSGAVAIAARLANAFPRTGLWPVLWTWGADSPAGYVDPPGRLSAIGKVNVRSLLAHLWYEEHRSAFPGLASPAPLRAVNPFAIFSNYNSDPRLDGPPYHLLLVPCRRPADAVTVTGLELGPDPGTPTNEEISAVLRSWEDRFGATVVQFGMGWFGLAVASPPTDYDNAMSLATELFAMKGSQTPPDEPVSTDAETLVTGGSPQRDDIVVTRNIWEIGWS